MGVTCLQAAVGQGHIDLALFLLDNGAFVNGPAAESGGVTALQAALNLFTRDSDCKEVDKAKDDPRLALLTLLLDRGADPNWSGSPNKSLSTLTTAVLSGRMDLIHFLLRRGLNPNLCISYRSPLGEAVAQDDIDIVLCLINARIDVDAWYEIEPNSCHSHDFYPYEGICGTPLQVAAHRGNVEIARLLLDAGAEIDMARHRSPSMTALQYAVKGNHTQMVKFLLNKGADPNIFVGDSPLELGLIRSWAPNLEVIAALINAGADTNPTHANRPTRSLFHLLAGKNYGPELVCLLLKSGASVNGTYDGMTVLQSIVERNRIVMVEMLLNAGANVNAPAGPNGEGTALQQATSFRDLEMVKLLLSHGADVNAPGGPNGGRTALQYATLSGNLELVKLLLSHGADVNAPGGPIKGRTALQQATEKGDLEIVNLLLSHGAEVNAPASRYHGITALQGAMLEGSLKMVLTLLEAGAHINDAPGAANGRTALEAAAEWGRLDIVHLLLNNDSEPDTIEARCERAAEYAELNYHSTIARDLRQHRPKR